MIRLGAALLCDAASLRENLVHILGGGITQIVRPDYPAPLACDIAITIYVGADDIDGPFPLSAVCADPKTGEDLFGFEVIINVSPEPTHGPQSVSIVIPFSGMGIPEPGQYWIKVSANGAELGSVPFTALKSDVQTEEFDTI